MRSGADLSKALGSAWKVCQWQETLPVLCPGLQDQSVSKGARKRPPPDDLEEYQRGAGKAPWKQLPTKPLKKKPGAKSKLTFTGDH